MMWGIGFGNGAHWWLMAVEALVAVLFVTGVVFAVIAAVRPANESPPSGTSARSILEGRLARGEIDEQEFQRRSSLLSQT